MISHYMECRSGALAGDLEPLRNSLRNPRALFGVPKHGDLEVSYSSPGLTRPSRANPTHRVGHCSQSRKTLPGPTQTRQPKQTRRHNPANRTGPVRALHYLSFVRALNYQGF